MTYLHLISLTSKLIYYSPKFIALSATIPFTTSLVAQAQTGKPSKELMGYVDKPKGDEQCSNCRQFIPGKTPEADGECVVVDGSISPHGWCNAYSKKS
ncbi:hypothetical protein W03_09080 [Nitrosomonas sp. PY1]|uniref:high-potential iron-sulfur protein n=1 Tax=Nitrosomonas sp. PY1 TaxID=1803906 RepID=UPI001FC7BC3A|nr:high-potential iron-sulfur protein [Nitrosomonas sp. PY1]GKS68904.1 hypothetical protein W03_09080 [Nitrosomonas sp. PY1]